MFLLVLHLVPPNKIHVCSILYYLCDMHLWLPKEDDVYLGTAPLFHLQVMTPNPECATIDTPIVDALHTMHDGKFLHLPVVDRGNILFRHYCKWRINCFMFVLKLWWLWMSKYRWEYSCCCWCDSYYSCSCCHGKFLMKYIVLCSFSRCKLLFTGIHNKFLVIWYELSYRQTF